MKKPNLCEGNIVNLLPASIDMSVNPSEGKLLTGHPFKTVDGTQTKTMIKFPFHDTPLFATADELRDLISELTRIRSELLAFTEQQDTA